MTHAPELIRLTRAARSVLHRIREGGGRPLLVGGTVRDALLARHRGQPTPAARDIDIEVLGVSSYEQLTAALDGLGYLDFRGQSYGVLALTIGGEDFDITLPRRDSNTGAGHRGFTVEVDPHLPEREAFARRDFTVNALGWDPFTGTVVDHFGGVADLEAGILRPTSAAFSEDPLRVLRGAQFIARFGFSPAPEFLTAARHIVDSFAELSVERVWAEWRKMLRTGTHIGAALRTLEDTGWLEHFPELARLRAVEQDPAWHPEGDVLTHSLLAADYAAAAAEADHLDADEREVVVAAALLHDAGKFSTTTLSPAGQVTAHGHDEQGADDARAFLTRLGAPQLFTTRVATLVREHMAHTSLGVDPTPAAVRRLVRRLGTGHVSIYDWARVVDADLNGRGPANRPSPAPAWVAVAERSDTVTARPGLLRGDHLIAAGFTPGPGFKAVLAAALDAQDAGEFDDEAGALAWFAASELDPDAR